MIRTLFVSLLVAIVAAGSAVASDGRPDRWNYVYAAYASGLLIVVGYAAFVAVRWRRLGAGEGAS